MDELLTSVFPGGVLFKRPNPGDIQDWTPDTEYGPHPGHVAVDDDRVQVTAETERRPVASAASAETPEPSLVVTARDIQIFCFLARHRMATYDQLALAFATSVHALRQRLPRLRAAGYLTKESPGAPAFAVWMVTDEGMKRTGLDLPVPTFTTVYEHTLGLTDLALMYAGEGFVVLTETEIRAGDKLAAKTRRTISSSTQRPASEVVGLPPFTSPRMGDGRHRPDMVVYDVSGPSGHYRCVAVELELTRKGPKRLRPILRAYRKAEGIDKVIYYAPDREKAAGVARAAKDVGAEHMVEIRKFVPRTSRS